MDLSALDRGILGPAMVAGRLVLATHVPLGMQVLDRGIVFIDLAIAQIAGCGVLLADRLGFEAEGIAVQVAALAAALLGALLLTWTERLWPDFKGIHLLEAIADYQLRERRYGGLSDSVGEVEENADQIKIVAG